MNDASLSLADVLRAKRRIAPFVRRTPLVESAWLSDLTGGHVALKLESLQVSNSFKSRGAFNAVIRRAEESGSERRPLVTASAGNHGRALAVAAEAFGFQLTVFTPKDAPRTKVEAIRRHGAELRPDGVDYDAAEKLALAHARRTGWDFVSPYNDIDVIAGAATIALEIFEDAPDVDVFVVPIGGGGLLSGMGTVVRAIAPSRSVYGVEVQASCAFQTSLRAGKLVEIVPGPTLADGLGGNPDAATVTFAFIRRVVDDIVTVSEADLAGAVAGLVEHEHVIAEGAGAASVAVLSGRRLDVRGRRVAAVVTGGNIDRTTLVRVLQSAAGPSTSSR